MREPDKKTSDPGVVYLWLRKVDDVNEATGKPVGVVQDKSWLSAFEYKADDGLPRCHKVNYNRKTHEAIKRAKRSLAKGKPVIGEFNQKNGGLGIASDKETGGQGNAPPKQSTQAKPNPGYGPGHRQGGEFRFYDLPPAKYPEKYKE